MAHVGKESRFQTVGLFSPVSGCCQFHFHFLTLGNNQRRTYQSKRFPVFITGLYRSLRLHPLHPGNMILYADDAIFLLYLIRTPFQQVLVGLFHTLTVFLEYF